MYNFYVIKGFNFFWGGGGGYIKKAINRTSLSQDQMHMDVWQKRMVRKHIYTILEIYITTYIEIKIYFYAFW